MGILYPASGLRPVKAKPGPAGAPRRQLPCFLEDLFDRLVRAPRPLWKTLWISVPHKPIA